MDKKKCYEGCLIGGAVGDALGYPIEFWTEEQIFETYGREGIRTLEEAGDPAVISDDTQMTLFAANALIFNKKHHNSDWTTVIRTAYREWYATQTGEEKLLINGTPLMEIYQEKRLHARRAPGNTCMNAIYCYINNPNIREAENNSKGCGTVMRAAPYGLSEHYDPKWSYGDAGRVPMKMAGYDAKLTHGHDDAWKASVTLADIIYRIAQYDTPDSGKRLQDVIEKSLGLWDQNSCIRMAIALAENRDFEVLEAIHMLGEGWVADEALAIAIFCAIRYQDDFAKAIRIAVNHKGDSDSTGAICGNILGAWLGIDAVKKAFTMENLEMHELIMKIADELYEAVEG